MDSLDGNQMDPAVLQVDTEDDRRCPATALSGSGILERQESAPLPLLRPEEGAEVLPEDSLGPLWPAVAAISTLTQAPVAIAAQSVLAAASLSVQRLVNVETLVDEVPCSLMFLTIAQSGERKSACDKLALKPVREFQEEREKDYVSTLEVHRRDLALHEAEQRAILKTQDVIEREADLEQLGPPPTPPPAPHILFDDLTIEGLQRHFDCGQPSVGIFSDEGGQLFGGYSMSAENKLKTSTALSKLWDGSEITRARASALATKYYGRRMTFHLMVQPLIAEKFLADPTIRDQGLLSRMLLAWPGSRIGYREEVSEDDRSDALHSLVHYHERTRQLFEIALPTGASPRELSPRTLPLLEDTRNLLRAFAHTVEISQRPKGPCAGIQGFASKAAEQAARIAGIMTIFENPEATEVSVTNMAAAISLMDWYLREARRLLDTGPLSSETINAEALRVWLVEHRMDKTIDIRTVVRCGPGRFRETAVIKKLFRILEEHGWIVPLAVTGRKKRWRIIRP